MALEATIRNDRRFIKVTVGADTAPGVVVQVPDGRAGVHNGTQTVPSGGVGTIDTECIAEVASETATTFSEGDSVFWNNTTKKAQPTSGDFALGKAAKAKGAGQLVVLVAFNVTLTT